MGLGKRFWHRAPQKEIDEFIKSKPTFEQMYNKYQQPGWCTYPEALSGAMGCWSLVGDNRTAISKSFCKTCDLYKKKRKSRRIAN
jgi:hypothetical protein